MKFLKHFFLLTFLLVFTQCLDNEIEQSNEDFYLDESIAKSKNKEQKDKSKKWSQDFASIKDEILSRNKNKKFLDKLIRTVGHPNWDEAFSVSEDRASFPYFIPFLRPDDHNTNAVLMVSKNKNGKKLEFKLFDREFIKSNIKNSNRKKIFIPFASVFSIFDMNIYDHIDHDINELIRTYTKQKSKSFGASSKGCDQYQICVTVHYVEDSDCQSYGACPTWSVTDCFWVSECSTDNIEPFDFTGGYANGGGSSGSTSTTCVTCDIDLHYPEDYDPSTEYSNLNEGQYYKLLVEGFTIEEIDVIDQLKRVIQDQIQNLNFLLPQTQEDFELLAEAIKIELEKIITNPRTLTKLVLPGVADIESALQNYNSGDLLNAGFDISMALVDLIPGTKLANISSAVAGSIRRSLPVVKIFKTVKIFGNSKVSNGFKKTLLKEMKNPHIFRNAPGHLGDPDFDYILERAGGQFELIGKVYEGAYKEGGLANIPFGSVSEVTIQLYGRNVRFKAKNLTEFGVNQIRIDDFWIP